MGFAILILSSEDARVKKSSFKLQIKIILSVFFSLMVLLSVSSPQGVVLAAPSLTIMPLTWNIIGLDSNNPDVGPSNFPVGARICNTGPDPATNVTATFNWEDGLNKFSGNNYINLRAGSYDALTISSIEAGSVASPTCYDFYFEVSVTRHPVSGTSYDKTRRYTIDVVADGPISLSTPTPREIYVEHLISQNRNSTDNIKLDGVTVAANGTMMLQVGNTYTIELDASTATQGYNQLEDFINFPNTVFQVLSVQSHYSADSSGYVANSSDKLYADACLWDNDPNSPTYRSCIGSDGKIGGTISTIYTVKIIGGTGSTQALNTLIYDFSGSSYHYNSDFSSQVRYAAISSPLGLSKSFTPASIPSGGTSTLSIAITNSSSSQVDGVSLTDILPSSPDQMSVASIPAPTTSAGCVSPTFSPGVGDTTITYTGSVAANSTCTVTVDVTVPTDGTYANSIAHNPSIPSSGLLINGSDSGLTAAANLVVEPTPSSSCTLVTIAHWTISDTTRPPVVTNTDSGVTALAYSNGVDQSANSTWWRITDPTDSSSVILDTDKYFRFQIPTANYTDVKLSFSYTRGNSGPANLDVYYGNSPTISTTAPTNPTLLAGAQFTPTTATQTANDLDFTGKTNTTGDTYFFLYVYNGASNQGVNNWAGINNITFTGCRPSQTIQKAFSPNPIGIGGASTLTFTLTNLDTAAATAAFSDSLPSGLTVATTAATPQCSGSVTAVAGSSVISLSGGTIPASGSCTITVDVNSSTAGVYPNISGHLTANGTILNSQASDTLTVLKPPVISKSFSPNPIYTGDTSTLTFTITNPNVDAVLSGLGFTDTFPTSPANLTMDTPPTTPQCGGTVSYTSGSITLNGGSLAAGESCTVTVVTTASMVGSYANASGEVSAVISGVTYNGNTASDTLGVQDVHPAISILKQVSTSASGPWASTINVAPGSNVYYRLTIENVGDVPLSPVSVTDPTLDISSCVWPPTLPVGSPTVDPTTNCIVGPVSAVAGTHSNTATAHGTYNSTVYDSSSPSTAVYTTTNLTLVKGVTESSFSAAGDVLHYSYTITNNGTAALNLPATVTDSNTSVTCPAVDTSGNHDAFLDASENIVCTAAYTVTAFDVSVGSVTNTAFATIETVTSNTDRKTVYRNQPDLVVSKNNSTGGYVANGTPFTWTLKVSNNGPQDATFVDGQVILNDQLPTSGVSSYILSAPGAFSGITNSANIICAVDGTSELLTCTASGADVTIGATAGSFSVDIQVTPSVVGSLVNVSAVVDPDSHVTESNEGNNTGSDAVTVTDANHPPVATDNAGAVDAGTPTHTANMVTDDEGSGVDSDADSDTLTVTEIDGETDPANDLTGTYGTLNWAADGSYTYTLNTSDPDYLVLAGGATATDTFTYTISDGKGGTDTADIIITITGADDVPVANDDNFTATEDTPLNGDLKSDNGLGADVPSGDGGNVWSKLTDPSHGTVTVNADGTFSYTPAANYNGPDSFTYQICDVDGDCDPATVDITIDPVDDPVTADDESYSTNEDTLLTVAAANGVLPGDSYPDGFGSLTVTTDVSNGTLVLNTSDGSFTYMPDANWNGADSFEYQLCDADTGTQLPVDCDTGLVTITVDPVNDVPVANDDSFSTPEDTPLNGDLKPDNGSGTDVPSGDGGNVWSKLTDPSHGTVTVNTDGTFTYTPDANYNGSDSFTYQICDVDNDCDPATVNLTINSVNDIPVANDDSLTATEDTPLNGDLKPDNGSGADVPSGDGGNVWSKLTDPSHGTVTVNTDGTFTYTPDANYNGPDSFTYQICDVDNDCDSATVNLTVTSVEDPAIGIAKRMVSITRMGSGSFDVTLEFHVQNYGDVTLSNVQVTDDLAVVFPAPNTFTVQSVTVSGLSNASLTANLGYNGRTVTDLLTGSGNSLAVNGSGAITVVVRVLPSASGPFDNSAFASGDAPSTTTVTDESSDGNDPDNTTSCPACVNGDGDPTNNTKPTPITFDPNIFDPPFGFKELDASGLPVLRWTVIWINGNNFSFAAAVSDPIPVGTTYEATGIASGTGVKSGAPLGSTDVGVTCVPDPTNPASTTTTTWCYYEGPTGAYPRGRVVWEGVLGPDLGATNQATANDELYITFNVRVASGVTAVQNTATIDADLNNNENFTDPGEQNVASAQAIWQEPVTPVDGREGKKLPGTGFAPGKITVLPEQPSEQMYSDLGDLWLEVPSLGVKTPIVGVPKNAGVWDVNWLWEQAGWLQGTAFPTWQGNSVVTGHVYLPNGKPGPFVNLGNLRFGDQVIVHAFGQRYVYEIRTNRIILPTDMSPFQHEEKAWLTLLTCKGYDESTDTYKYRVEARAVLLKVEADQ
jgi:LPXTG-site transpeptidase (sortase) family protein